MSLRALSHQALILAVRISPFKKSTIEVLIRVAALRILLSRKRLSWDQIAGFTKLIGVDDTGWRFAYRYFVDQARLGAWNHLYYEFPRQLDEYMSIEGLAALKETTRAGRGAILVGAHYGPKLTTFLLRQHGIDARPLVSDQLITRGLTGTELRHRFGSSRRRKFFSQEMRPIEANRSERELVRHVREGGVALLLIDYPRPTVGGAPVSLFGQPRRLHYFPFKLALNYGLPVFFYFYERISEGGYRLRLTPAGDFATPAAGAADYAQHLEEHVRTHPFAPMSFIRSFLEPPPADEEGLTHSGGKGGNGDARSV